MLSLKLPRISGVEVIKALKKEGFEQTRQSGSHVILVKYCSDRKLTVTVPKHPELAKKTLLSIMKQANMSREEFLTLLH